MRLIFAYALSDLFIKDVAAWAAGLGILVVARLSPHTIRVCNLKKQKINLLSYEDKIPKMRARRLNVLIPVPPERPRRVTRPGILPKRKHGHARVVGARTIKGTVIWVLTTLTPEQISDAMVLELYRLCWQVGLLFKRLQSLLHIDALPTRDGPTAKSWILARLLAAVVAQETVQPSAPFSPRRYRLGKSPLCAQSMVNISDDPLGSQSGHALYRSLASHQ
jgi:hypothetical protein